MPTPVLLVTAFLEGLCVLLIEIIGARAMAPYFGGSLTVWTAQITATLLFLALGYRIGGSLSRRPSGWHLPLLFGLAGVWLLLYRCMRAALMTPAAQVLGVPAGSFASASALFGLPLLCLGAVSPVLIAAIDRSRPGAGSAAGSLFFINTLGGLAGGWATAFLVIPYLSVTTALATTGAGLVVLALFWATARRGLGAAVMAALGGAGGAALLLAAVPGPRPLPGALTRLLYERQSAVGTLQVVDYYALGWRAFLIDGVMQNVVDLESGRTLQPYTDYLDALAYHFAPGAKRALILGLGAGVLPRSLARRGLEVTAVDLDARVEEVARRFFDLPSGVRVEIADGRALLRRSRDTYDLVFIDAFAGESAPWHLLTVEAFAEAAERLGPGGRLVVNIVTMGRGETLGLARVKAGLRQVFPAARVFLGQAEQASGVDLRNAILVAGLDLEASGESRRPQDAALAAALDSLLPGHPADVTVLPATDDWSDLDYSDAAVRALYRSMVVQVTPPAGQ